MQVGQTLRIGGWVKTGREAGGGAWVFLEVNDGSCFQSLQVPYKSLLGAIYPHRTVSSHSKATAFS